MVCRCKIIRKCGEPLEWFEEQMERSEYGISLNYTQSHRLFIPWWQIVEIGYNKE